MADYGVAVLAAIVIVGMVGLAVAAFIWLALRWMDKPPSERIRRRMARLTIAFGVVELAFIPISLAMGGGMVWIFGVLQGPLLIAMGWAQLHDLHKAGAAQPR